MTEEVLSEESSRTNGQEEVAKPKVASSDNSSNKWPRILKSRVRSDPLKSSSLAQELIDAFRKYSDRVLLIDSTSRREWNGAQMLDTTGRVACALHELVGLKTGDIVMTVSGNSAVETIIALGAIMAGTGLYSIPFDDSYEDMKSSCELIPPNLFVITRKNLENVLKLKRQVKGLSSARIVVVDAEDNQSNLGSFEDRVLSSEDLLNHKYDETLVEMIAGELIDTMNHAAVYVLTSGSTGQPKVVPLAHMEFTNIIGNLISATKYPIGSNDDENCPFDPLGEKYKDERILPITEDDKIAGDLPLDHGVGLDLMFLSFLIGAKFVRMPSYNVDVYWQTVSDFGITVSINGTSFGYLLLSHLKELIDSNQTDRYDLSRFKFMALCGANLAYQSLADDVSKVYTNMHISQAYGSSEIGFLSMVPMADCNSHRRSVGFVLPGFEFKVLDMLGLAKIGDKNGAVTSSDLAELSTNLPDLNRELLFAGKSKFQRYRCHPDEEVGRAEQMYKEAHFGRFYRTGDLGHFDPMGRIYIQGRSKDALVLMEDWKIMPIELEQLIDSHPLVKESAVVGMVDKDLPGFHAPKAYCTLHDPRSVVFNKRMEEHRRGETGDKECDVLLDWLVNNDRRKIAKHIYDFVAERTRKPKHLKGGVCIIDGDFQRVGRLQKIDRKVLRNITQNDLII